MKVRCCSKEFRLKILWTAIYPVLYLSGFPGLIQGYLTFCFVFWKVSKEKHQPAKSQQERDLICIFNQNEINRSQPQKSIMTSIEGSRFYNDEHFHLLDVISYFFPRTQKKREFYRKLLGKSFFFCSLRLWAIDCIKINCCNYERLLLFDYITIVVSVSVQTSFGSYISLD